MDESKDIFDKLLQQRPKRGRITLFLDLEVYAKFKELCDKKEVAYSEVLEEFMRNLLTSAAPKKKR